MIDADLAEMYEVETKRLNEQVKRNIERFPDSFRFQLIAEEQSELVANCDRFEKLKHSSSRSYAFTEQGVAMLSAVLHSARAVKVSIQIINAFVEMRKLLNSYEGLIQRVDRVELKQLEHDGRFQKLLSALGAGSTEIKQGVFFDGQTFDAYNFSAEVIRSAQKSIQLIDNYVDDSVLLLLAKRKKDVSACIYGRKMSKIFQQDLDKHHEQYEEIFWKKFDRAHDRFLIIDEKRVYHIGASLKDLGKKWFAFSLLDKDSLSIIERLKKL